MDETTDFSALCARKILKALKICSFFSEKEQILSAFAVPIDTKTYASIRFVSICPLSHIMSDYGKGL